MQQARKRHEVGTAFDMRCACVRMGVERGLGAVACRHVAYTCTLANNMETACSGACGMRRVEPSRCVQLRTAHNHAHLHARVLGCGQRVGSSVAWEALCPRAMARNRELMLNTMGTTTK